MLIKISEIYTRRRDVLVEVANATAAAPSHCRYCSNLAVEIEDYIEEGVTASPRCDLTGERPDYNNCPEEGE